MFGSYGKPSHLCVNINSLLQRCCSLFGVCFPVAVGGVNECSGGFVLAPSLYIVLGYCVKGVTGLTPLLGHLEEVGSLSVQLQSLVYTTPTSKQARKETF